jgi:hypothetical protein
VQPAQTMQNATKASSPHLPSSVLRESFKKALEMLEDSPTEGLVESMCVVSGVVTQEELFSDHKLFEKSLHQLLGDETANTILAFLHVWKYWASPRRVADVYARTVSSIADNTIAATKLVNNAVFSNLDAFKTCVQNARDNLKEVSRIGVNAAKTFEQASRDTNTAAARSVGF